MKKNILIAILLIINSIILPYHETTAAKIIAAPKEVCILQNRKEFESRAFSMKFSVDGSCAIFYKASGRHMACWTDTETSAGVKLTSVNCK